LAALNDGDGAREAFLRAAALEPDDPEIRAVLRSLPSESGSSDVPALASSGRFLGDLKSFPLTELLEFLRLQKKTGLLDLWSPRRGTGAIHLVRGQITSATAPGVERFDEALL